MTVLRAAKAKLVAKLVETKVLPDDTMNEVNMMTWAPSLRSFMYSKLDLIRRNDSESESRPFSFTMMAWSGVPPWNGISPKKGTFDDFCTSMRSWIVVSIRFFSTRKTMGMARPIRMPMSVERFSLGATGLLLG